MAKEIERKFLVASDAWRRGAKGVAYRQGYLSAAPERTVRVRTMGRQARLTVKGKAKGYSRDEFEYPIPLAHAKAMLRLCLTPLIEKTRYKVRFKSHFWEIDVFRGANLGLVTAEIELARAGERFERPPWLGREVTGDHRYSNSRLVARPFSKWASKAG
jgi:adenylate cyclase